MTEQLDLADPVVREQVAKQYRPLVFKIANQQRNKTALSFDDVVGYAFEGLAAAMNDYDPSKGQTFRQYAGFKILYHIQNGGNLVGHIVRFSAYMQKKAKEEGKSTWIMKSIDVHTDEDGEEHYNIPVPTTEMKQSRDEIMQELYTEIENHFNQHDCEIFYKSYGLKDYEMCKGIDLAKSYGCSGPNITLICKKIINFIRKSDYLMDELAELL